MHIDLGFLYFSGEVCLLYNDPFILPDTFCFVYFAWMDLIFVGCIFSVCFSVLLLKKNTGTHTLYCSIMMQDTVRPFILFFYF